MPIELSTLRFPQFTRQSSVSAHILTGDAWGWYAASRSSVRRFVIMACIILPLIGFISAQAESVKVTVDVDESIPGMAIPADFLGLSYEKNVLALEHFNPSNTALVNLLRLLGNGVLRLGGNYVESTTWVPDGPKKITENEGIIGRKELEDMFGFARACRWSVIHGLNLGANNPELAAEEARVAQTIGGDSLLAFEIGNEPELYPHRDLRPKEYDYANYELEVAAYRVAMRRVLGRVPLAGPATTSKMPWLKRFLKDYQSDVVVTTRHNYPLAASCTDPTDPRFGSVKNLLSPETAAAWQKLLGEHQQVATEAGVPFRVGECGSASSGGSPGVSDTFASALWCADYLFDIAILGVAGVNFHGSFNCRGYTSFCATKKGGYHVHGNYYGMLFFRQAAQGHVLPVKSLNAGVNLTCHAVRGIDGVLRVALINKDLEKSAQVSIKVGNRVDPAGVMRLSAPALSAKSGITLGGAEVSLDGEWAPLSDETIPVREGEITVDVPVASAALVALVPPNRAKPVLNKIGGADLPP